MKLAGAKAEAFLKSPTECPALTLVFSADTAKARREIQGKMRLVLGENAAEDMRLHQFSAKEITRDPALLSDALRTKSFFPGPTGVVIFEATDTLSKVLIEVFDTHDKNDGFIFVQAGNLTKASKLRKTFEASQDAMVIGLYDEPMSAHKANMMIENAKLRLDATAKEALASLGLELEIYEFGKLLETISIFQGDADVLTLDEIMPLLPIGQAQAVDSIVHQILTGQNAALLKNLKRAPAQGISIHQILAMTNIQVRNILSVKVSKDAQSAISSMRPPLFGPRRDRFMAELSHWPLHHIETAQAILQDTEKNARSGSKSLPLESYIERQFLKICIMARKNKGA